MESLDQMLDRLRREPTKPLARLDFSAIHNTVVWANADSGIFARVSGTHPPAGWFVQGIEDFLAAFPEAGGLKCECVSYQDPPEKVTIILGGAPWADAATQRFVADNGRMLETESVRLRLAS